MGITNLTKLLKDKKVVPQQVHLKSMGPGVAAVDAYNYMHKFLCNRDPNQFILSIADQLYHLLKFGIIPVFIFDGKVHPDKKSELERRSKIRDQTRAKLEQMEAAFELATAAEQKKMIPIMITYRNQLVHVKEEHIIMVKKLLRLFRLPFLEAPNDAEALACYLNSVKKVDFVITEDSDCLVFNCIKQLRGYTNNSFNKLDLYTVADINKQLGINSDQMIDLGILLGTDYSPDLFPPGKAYSLIKEYQSIEGIIKNLEHIKKQKMYQPWVDMFELFENNVIDYHKLRNIFKHDSETRKVAGEFTRPNLEFRKFSPKRIKYLKLFLIKCIGSPGAREAVLRKTKMFEFLTLTN